MTSMRARFNELSAQLTRLNHGLSASPAEPANPGFEPNVEQEGSRRPTGRVLQGGRDRK